MVALLKTGEQFGFYIDSERPYFRLKIETAHQGTTRCMLLPEEFQEFPPALHGLVRVHKLYAQKPPYESVLRVEGLPLREIVNRVLHESYQVNCAMLLSEVSDQSVLLHQLPPASSDADPVRQRRSAIRGAVQQVFAGALHEPQEIEEAFAAMGFRLLGHRLMRFHCSCTRERMIANLRPVLRAEGPQLFDPSGELDLVCEYCKTHYRIQRAELCGHSAHEH
jgi:molecular chaperone Hsp33